VVRLYSVFGCNAELVSSFELRLVVQRGAPHGIAPEEIRTFATESDAAHWIKSK
jgi:hypothetical protein